MALLDLLGRRWALRIVWELREDTLTFRELQARCGGISSSVLNQRLRELRDAGIVAAQDRGGLRAHLGGGDAPGGAGAAGGVVGSVGRAHARRRPSIAGVLLGP